ncbi:lipopolysaccharide biosynthesis protein [Methyloglobulus morosus KoM1]|uniref:Lipopolysaccharide biosynthesis protein n=1 Tax=Methyloglobulus morosus KoM1 TaxID=1116472 RepID=V5C1T5_9GAMM|nr:LPS biosynthesis protein [Methyloglobulus morosus]ESS72447.1 lipopolysaccharide biosynthesis protein [Methyloglobulus morosus KoM1]
MALNIKTFSDCLDLAKRHKYYIVIPWLLTSVISVIVALNLPKIYRSKATILIETPIPTNLFESSMSHFAEEQIQSLYQRVMTTDNVISIIESNGLYNDVKKDLSKYELADSFKGNTEVTLTTSSLTPNSKSVMTAFAFDIAFSHREPTKAKEIASALAKLFISQNDKTRTERAIKATDFLMEESEKLNRELQEVDNNIAIYKEQNSYSLPDQAQGNLAAIDRTENELRDTENQIRTTKERIAFLAAELARAQEVMPSKSDDKTPQTKDEALRSLRAEYLRLTSIYSPAHPTLIRLKREIKALDPGFEEQPAVGEVLKQLKEAQGNLKALEETYSENHPDIARQKIQIERLEQKLKSNPLRNQSESKGASVDSVTNPAYLGVEAQYKSSQSELQLLIETRNFLKTKLDNMHQVVSVAPQVEKGYNDLIRERDNTVKKYNQLKEKWLDAKLFQTQVEQQQGQTLTIIEQPVIPTHPEKAIRRKVAIGGFIAGLLMGIGLAFLVELLDPKLRGFRAIAEVTGLMPIVVIPYIETVSEVEAKLAKQRKEKKIIVWVVVSGIILIALSIFLFLSFSA